jgi:primosomal protein N' (replication factor Y)
MSPIILRVAIPTPVRKLFDYLQPLEDHSIATENFVKPAVGARILVPFGKQKKVGIIAEVTHKTDCPTHKLKSAHAILDNGSLFPSTLLELIRWASRYYQSSLGEVFEAAIPKRLRQEPKEKKLTSKKKAVASTPILINSTSNITIPTLNVEQRYAVETITKYFGKFQTLLLEGVTGSGKTEVYIRIIEHCISIGKQALILVPEIGLTPQLLTRFQERFQLPIAVLHSSLTEKQRYDAWQQAKTGTASIVIGTRSTVFVPLLSPGVFILDEEHDGSFKQQEGFRYHARDVAIMRGSLEKCPVILGTATPSLETLHNVHSGRFQRLRLPVRAGKAVSPTVQVLDIRHKKLDEGLSPQLIEKMQQHLHQQGQILIFLNRRGFAPVLMCFDCGWTANCAHCDARLTLHFQSQTLRCHHCDASIPLYTKCPHCHHPALKPLGIGTERLEAALQRLFPDHSVSRLDRDTTRKKNAIQETIERIHKEETHILLGTQMIAKGHHFPNVTLVAILDIDHGLFSTDFRSLEKMGQLITQVAGRAGRSKKAGHVILQTCHPHHPLLNKLLEQGYPNFAQALLTERQAIHLPPYSYQILIRAEATKRERTSQFLLFIKTLLMKKQIAHFKILGPIPAPMERKIGKFRAQLLLQATNRSMLQTLMKELILKIENHPLANTVKWSLDVDPIDLY